MPHSISRAEEFIVWCVKTGVLEVRDDGTIWRLAKFSRTGRIIPLVTPRRADKPRKDGYCRVGVLRKFIAMSHRIVWASQYGPTPEGMEINHKDGKRCRNPLENLEPMTPGENGLHAYRVLGKRAPSGERHPKAKLSWEQVGEIRKRHAAGEAGRALAREFGVSHTNIRAIVSGRYWRDQMPEIA